MFVRLLAETFLPTKARSAQVVIEGGVRARRIVHLLDFPQAMHVINRRGARKGLRREPVLERNGRP